ncbi:MULTISPECIES: hypothetical protein [unclassified Streptomyces]|uniref:hypothetical protein n=1 Tax=unclassified Streptomyces TaxID=2593676 RepID=UPI00371D7240
MPVGAEGGELGMAADAEAEKTFRTVDERLTSRSEEAARCLLDLVPVREAASFSA